MQGVGESRVQSHWIFPQPKPCQRKLKTMSASQILQACVIPRVLYRSPGTQITVLFYKFLAPPTDTRTHLLCSCVANLTVPVTQLPFRLKKSYAVLIRNFMGKRKARPTDKLPAAAEENHEELSAYELERNRQYAYISRQTTFIPAMFASYLMP